MKSWVLKFIILVIKIKPILNKINFMVFIDHKVTCCRVGVLHGLNGIDTMDT